MKTENMKCLRAAAEEFLELLYPRRCPICQKILDRKEKLVCEECGRKLPYIREPLCKKCGKPLTRREQEYCPDCETGRHHFTEGRSIFLYEKELRHSVHRMKFENKREYLDFYAWAMARAGKDFMDRIRPAVLMPVPMHPGKRRERGFDQSRILAEKLGKLTGISVDARSLTRNRFTLPQKDLDVRERKRNLRGAFSVKKGSLLREPVLLIDDIYTTGATMDEIARTLENEGIKRIYFLALCTGKGK